MGGITDGTISAEQRAFLGALPAARTHVAAFLAQTVQSLLGLKELQPQTFRDSVGAIFAAQGGPASAPATLV